MKASQSLVWGAVLGLAGVALGASGAHALRELLEMQQRTDTFELAVRYQFYHAGALLAYGIFQRQVQRVEHKSLTPVLFLAGVLLFSGSLYVLALTGFRPMAWLTPVGGLALLSGWSFFLRDIFRLGRQA